MLWIFIGAWILAACIAVVLMKVDSKRSGTPESDATEGQKMRKLARFLETFGWLLFVLGVIVGLGLAFVPKPDDFFEALSRFGFGVLPGALLLLFCLAHKHYLNVAGKIDDYLTDKMSQPTSWQVQPPTFANMPPAPPPASRQKPQQPGELAKE